MPLDNLDYTTSTTTAPTVCTIGTCRINRSIEWARASLKNKLKIENERLYSYTHTTKEALQQVDLIFGLKSMKPEIWPLISSKHYVEKSRGELPVPQYFIVEISSLKDIVVRGFHIKINLLMQRVRSAALMKIFWELPGESQRDERRQRLEATEAFGTLEPEMQEILLEAVVVQQDLDVLITDIRALKQRLPNLLIVTHCNATGADGAPIESRRECVNLVRTAAERVGVPVFEPGLLLEKWGQRNAMINHGLDTAHYRRPFGRYVGETLGNIILAMAEGKLDPASSDWGAATDQSVISSYAREATGDPAASLTLAARDRIAQKLLRQAKFTTTRESPQYLSALETAEELAPDSEFVVTLINRQSRALNASHGPELLAGWLRLKSLTPAAVLRLATISGAPAAEALARVVRLGVPTQVAEAWDLLLRRGRLIEAATAFAPRRREPNLYTLQPRFEKDLFVAVRRMLEEGRQVEAAIGVVAFSLVFPASPFLAKLDAFLVRGLEGANLGPRPDARAEDAAFVEVMTANRLDFLGARLALALSLARTGEADRATQEISEMLRDYPDAIKPLRGLYSRAEATGAFWISAPLLMGFLDTPYMRERTSKNLMSQFKLAFAQLKQAVIDKGDVVEAARNVLLLDPDYGPARERLAEALAAKGDWKAALEYWIAADDDESETID